MPSQIHSLIQFQFPDLQNQTTITLKKTIQVANDGNEHPLPPDRGDFPYYFNGTQRIVPMNHENEALWLYFQNSNALAPVAIKIMAGGINAVTGEKETEETYTTLRNNGENGTGQNYMIVPAQRWLDGFMSKDKTVRQFIAVALGQGKSVEEKLEGTQRGGLQIIVVPTKKEIVYRKMAEQREQQRLAEEAREKRKQEIRQLEASIKEKEESLIQKRQEQISTEEITALEDEIDSLKRQLPQNNKIMRLTSQKDCESSLDSVDLGACDELENMVEKSDDMTNASVDFYKHSKSSSSSLIGSLWKKLPTFKMGLGGGGKIKQNIVASTIPVDNFDPAKAQYMDLDLINLKQFAILTGLPVPPREPNAEEYTNAGGLWFDLLSAEQAVRADHQSRLVALEEAGTLSALPAESAMTVPNRQIVSIGAGASLFNNLSARVQAALHISNSAATTQSSTARESASSAPNI